MTIAISYDTDIKKVKKIITAILKNNQKVLQTPASEVAVKNLTDNAIQLEVRSWANNKDYGIVLSETLESCKLAFDIAGIVISLMYKNQPKVLLK